MSQLTTLLVGDRLREEFREAIALLEATSEVTAAANVAAAESLLAEKNWQPDVVVVAQSWPGQFSVDQVARLQQHLPLTRFLGLLGSQCEGEHRSGRPWPGVTRTYWYHWAPRWRQLLASHVEGRWDGWALPATATAEERLMDSPVPSEHDRGELIAIHTPYFQLADSLADACRTRGLASAWIQPGRPSHVRGAAAVVWDCDHFDRRTLAELRAIVERFPAAPIAALAAFPRRRDHDALLAAGALCVLGKPFLLDDLFEPLLRVIDAAADSQLAMTAGR